MEEKQQIQISVDPNVYALTNVNINISEEQFIFGFFSGAQVRQFFSTPKHAKRFCLLLQNHLENYEKQFGKLETQLPSLGETKGKEEEIGFSK